jgi:ParB-like chromosome segregation protein Spo0J
MKDQLLSYMESLKNEPIEKLVNEINELREIIHNYSPFKNEPVDFVKWIPNKQVIANDYNPNKVAPPEMQLLEVSIDHDGYTQPIVTWPHEQDDWVEVIDGFHRHRVGKESPVINQRVKGYLPTVIIRSERADKNDRIASTIRHNRARGKHTVDAMSEIVLELKNRNWRNERIAKELGMDEEEILRLCQISGLSDIFKDDDFSRAWNIEDSEEDDFTYLTDEVTEDEKQQYLFRTANTSDPERIFHTFDKWECQKAGFYESSVPGKSKEQCETEYFELLSNEKEFRAALDGVITKWKYSCEHYLTNKAMNRVAWLGQAALCYSRGIPSSFRGGFHLLTKEQQDKANEIAHEYLNKWFRSKNRQEISLEEALSVGRQVEIY